MICIGNLSGGVRGHGKLESAQLAFQECLAIFQQLAKRDPSNVDCQRNLAVAYGRIGGVLQDRREFAAAQAAFDQDLAIFRHLAERDPNNPHWQREVAVVKGRLGDVLFAQGDVVAAKKAFDECLVICRLLTEQDQSNADWQWNLAVACRRLAGVEANAQRESIAAALYEEAFRILTTLVETAPDVVQFGSDLKKVEAELAAFRLRREER
jgi:tetratricopeptide (TPR) repeat protein